LAVFIWHAKTIHNLWYCPVRVLIWESLIWEETKIYLGEYEVENIRMLECEIKRENYFKKQKIIDRQSANYKKNG
jgi:hypothetical protein